ncbi:MULTISPECIES: peptidoglycan DD-metalloendopeptidase family protein [unclassified Microbacterium]|uniref:peptidoglycan DD-metalloendopeptidase family protein n=1 Tax=unclassified Microbacterium TaxID=2609290 RepID=UPI0038696BF0
MSRTHRRRTLWSAGATVAAIALTLSMMSPAAAVTPQATPPVPTPVVSPVTPATPLPTATPTPPPAAAPRPFTTVGTPTISGTASFGKTLTAAPGTWKPAPTVAYRWHLDGVPVSGAGKKTWTLPASAVGKKVTVVVTATRTGYRATSVASAPTAKVAPGRLAAGTPTVAGTPSVGKKLTAAAGTWGPKPVTVKYQWLREGRAIAGATSSSYTLVAADRARLVSVRVSATKSGYTSTTRTTAGVRVGLAFTKTVAPTVRGTVAVGGKLTASAGAWGPSPVALKLQWYRGSSAIKGATTSTYALTAADAGKKVSVRATGTKAGYTTQVRASTAVAVPKVLTVPKTVAVSGTRTVGSTLTAAVGSWRPAPVTFSYQWMRNGSPIAGATSRTYRLVDADATRTVSVKVTGKKSGYTTVSRTSPAVGIKWAFTSSPTPVVSGTPKAGQILQVAVGAWKPAPTLRIEWRVDGSVITGATGTSWEVPVWAAGRKVTVSVTATKRDYVTVTRASAERTVSWSLGSTITPGTSLRSGVYLSSPNGAYRFGLLGDGNLALLQGTQPIRDAKTTGTMDGTLQLSGDGELLLLNASNATVWSTRTAGRGATALALSDNGTLALVAADGSTVWSSDALTPFSEPTAATGATPGRHGWAYPLRPNGTFTTYAGHSGDDIAAPRGTPVYAMRGGTVKVREIWITSGCPSWAPNRSRQKEVVITSTIDGTRFEQVYAHLDSFSVTTGQQVAAGQRIGAVGSTGCSTGPHLHTAFTVDGVRYAMFPRDVLGVDSY